MRLAVLCAVALVAARCARPALGEPGPVQGPAEPLEDPSPIATFREAVEAESGPAASKAEKTLSDTAADLAGLQPGVVVERSLGADDRVRLRGLPAAFVATRFAGERLPSPGGIDRTAGLGLVPAEFLQTVRVSTVFTPDADGDVIAGAVDLVPLSPGTGEASSMGFSLTGAWNSRREEAQPGAHVLLGRNTGHGLRWLASMAAGADAQGADRLEWSYDGTGIDRFEGLSFAVDRERAGVLLAADGDVGESTSFGLRGIASELRESELRRRVKYDLRESVIERELKDSRVRKRLTLGTLDVARLLGPAHSLSARLTHAEASQREPDRVDTSFVATDMDFAANGSIPAPENESIAAFELDKIGFENNRARERTTSGRLDWSADLEGSRARAEPSQRSEVRLRAGLRSIGRNKRQDTTTDLGTPIATIPLAEYLASHDGFGLSGFDLGGMPGAGIAGRLIERGLLTVARSLAEEAGDYEASESVFAGYLMTEASIGDRWRTSFGLRYERARWRYRGFEVDEVDAPGSQAIRPVLGPESSREDFMPAASVARRLGERLEIRAAWSRTVARPRFYDLVPYRLVDREDQELTLGNPRLQPARSWNQDLEVSYCSGCLVGLEVNLFFRQIDGFFFVRRRPLSFEGQIFEVHEPVNGGDSQVSGLDVVATWRGRGSLGQFSGRLAATGSESSAQFPDRARTGSLPGQSDWVLKNLLAFERGRLSAALAASWSSASLAEIAAEPGDDRFEAEQVRVDLSLGWEFGRGAYPSTTSGRGWRGWRADLSLQHATDPMDSDTRFYSRVGRLPLRAERSGADLQVSISRRW